MALSPRGTWEAALACRERSPLIQCITNFVSMDLMANVVLAIGASPAMVRGGEGGGPSRGARARGSSERRPPGWQAAARRGADAGPTRGRRGRGAAQRFVIDEAVPLAARSRIAARRGVRDAVRRCFPRVSRQLHEDCPCACRLSYRPLVVAASRWVALPPSSRVRAASCDQRPAVCGQRSAAFVSASSVFRPVLHAAHPASRACARDRPPPLSPPRRPRCRRWRSLCRSRLRWW